MVIVLSILKIKFYGMRHEAVHPLEQETIYLAFSGYYFFSLPTLPDHRFSKKIYAKEYPGACHFFRSVSRTQRFFRHPIVEPGG
ncbi:MAG: hypothetical protein ABIK28_01870, partial [Planctomycetota bacterium]